MMRSVAVYLTQRLYGGPEEGGWRYDAGELCTDPVLTAFGATFSLPNPSSGHETLQADDRPARPLRRHPGRCSRHQTRDRDRHGPEVDVPTDKARLIGFLNENAVAVPAPRAATPLPIATPAIAPRIEATTKPASLDATSVLARMENPGISIDAIVEGIAAMKGGYALKRIAGAVAIRFEELSR